MTNNILAQICADKWQHILQKKEQITESKLINLAHDAAPVKGFVTAINNSIASGRNALIAEIKKASPSAGVIRESFDVAKIAKDYEEAGASCISVLTDFTYFKGDDRYINIVRKACSLPVLRKDFILDPYQVIESRAIGADCILLIMAALSDNQAKELEQVAIDFKMHVLVEVHNEQELERALSFMQSRLLGINNRDLKTLTVDLSIAEKLTPKIPGLYTVICESGIKDNNDVKKMNVSGIYAFLVGESLMCQNDIKKAVRQLLDK